jgi:hypothetical protein
MEAYVMHMLSFLFINTYSSIDILTYVYVFLNLETRKAYATMFERLFKVLQNVSRRLIHIKHIDQSEYGLCTITVDMCKKQAPGKIMHRIYLA